MCLVPLLYLDVLLLYLSQNLGYKVQYKYRYKYRYILQ